MGTFIFKFGKHKGKSLQIVEKIEPSYIEWARKNAPKLLEEWKPTPRPAPPRIEPPDESEVVKSAMQPNLDFFNEGKNGNKN